MELLDWLILITYLTGILFIGIRFRKFIKTGEDFLLAGKTLSWWAIGMGIVVADIGAYDLMGLSSGAYKYGISQANFDWIGCVPAMIIAAFIFIPYYQKVGVYTVPEYLGLRFHTFVRTIISFIWVVFSACTLGIFFHATATFMNVCFELPHVLNLDPQYSYWGSIILTITLVSIYTVAGGLAAITMNDVLHLIIMFIGGITVLVLGLIKVGGPAGIIQSFSTQGEALKYHLRLLVPTDAGPGHPYPWPAVILGLAFVLSPAYWIGNQIIVQKCLGAKDIWNGKAGMLWAAILKVAIPIFGVIPGLIALSAFPGLEDSNKAYPMLIKNLLPQGAKGLVVAAFFAALISSVEAYVSSGTTLFIKDLGEPLYTKIKHKKPSENLVVLSSRLLTIFFLIFGMFYASVAAKYKTIYDAMQTLFSLFQGPVLALLLCGMFWRGATRTSGIISLPLGLLFAGILTFFRKDISIIDTLFTYGLDDPYLYVSWWSFLFSVIVLIGVSIFTKKEKEENLYGLVYGLVLKDSNIQDTLKERLK